MKLLLLIRFRRGVAAPPRQRRLALLPRARPWRQPRRHRLLRARLWKEPTVHFLLVVNLQVRPHRLALIASHLDSTQG